MTEHIVTLSISVYDAASGQAACNEAYRMFSERMADLQYVVVDEDGDSSIHTPSIEPDSRPSLRLVKESE